MCNRVFILTTWFALIGPICIQCAFSWGIIRCLNHKTLCRRTEKALRKQLYIKRLLDVKGIILTAIIADNLKIQWTSAVTPQYYHSVLEATLYFTCTSLTMSSFFVIFYTTNNQIILD